MVEPVYLDLHIHTSENADELNTSYNSVELINNILNYNKNSVALISITDHNTINKKVYEELVDRDEKIRIILGVELHIRNYEKADPYHAHMFFKTKDVVNEIDNINEILNKLYPKKMVSGSNDNIPDLNTIINSFEKYDFMILPHGGQNHSTFEKSIPKGVNFDNTLERTIYYNQFDGFTARSNKGIQNTIEYFKKLNINEFVNLITGSDNYDPKHYPNPKGKDASEFVPTWMLAEPTFNGLRISLSEKHRIKYQQKRPEVSKQYIKRCYLKNDKIDIDVQLTSGLNVVIGESSSGKSLFIDSLYRSIHKDFDTSIYKDLGVENIEVENPFEFSPHYINQNFLTEKINNKKIADIDIIKSQFPKDNNLKNGVDNKLHELKGIITALINSVQSMYEFEQNFDSIPAIGKLIFEGTVIKNPILSFIISSDVDERTNFDKSNYDKYNKLLDEIYDLTKSNIFMEDVSTEINHIREAMFKAYRKSEFKTIISDVVKKCQKSCQDYIVGKDGENAKTRVQKDTLFDLIDKYIKEKWKYYDLLEKLSKFDYKIGTKMLEINGNKLYIENKLEITEDRIIEFLNNYLKSKIEVRSLKELSPNKIYKTNWKERPKINDYNDLIDKVYNEFCNMNRENYKIITKKMGDFDSLSPGWKAAIILELIFNSTSDYAPLVIDQPEDNLAGTYLNGSLIETLHKTKEKRQVIIVSHTATIPMLGDAQNVIVCRNDNGKIVVRNAPLEGAINDEDVVNIIARLTDGGKSSIKKRFKKYNFKKYKGDSNENSSI